MSFHCCFGCSYLSPCNFPFSDQGTAERFASHREAERDSDPFPSLTQEGWRWSGQLDIIELIAVVIIVYDDLLAFGDRRFAWPDTAREIAQIVEPIHHPHRSMPVRDGIEHLAV